MSRIVSYGWGVIPVLAKIGKTACSTSLFPNDRLYKDHLYMVPIKMVVQKAENLKVGDLVNIQLIIERLASSSDQE